MGNFGAKREGTLRAQDLQHFPEDTQSLKIPPGDRLYLSSAQPCSSSPCPAGEEAGAGAVKGMKVSYRHARTLPAVWERALCSDVFGLSYQSHNYFISFTIYPASEFCFGERSSQGAADKLKNVVQFSKRWCFIRTP